MSEKSITLTPSHKSLFWWYLLGIILIPLFGVGIYLIYRFYSSNNAISYRITDHSITVRDSNVEQKMDLANIQKVEVSQKWIDKKFGLGLVTIRSDSNAIDMIGMENPQNLADTIMSAAKAERKRLADLNTNKSEPMKQSKPGRDDRIDYLTGLWQQGLISEEDYEKERKHFE